MRIFDTPTMLLASLLFATAIPACAASSDDEPSASSADELRELRTDPNGKVATTDSSVKVLSGYNAFLDHSTGRCVTGRNDLKPVIGNVDGRYYVKQITSKEELANELEVDVKLGVKTPQAEGNGALKVVKTFKQSATTVTFLLRAVRSYEAVAVPGPNFDTSADNAAVNAAVDLKPHVSLTPENAKMLKSSPAGEFLQKCGGSFINAVRYQAQVVGILQFQARTIESARAIEAALGLGSNGIAKNITSASAEVKVKSTMTEMFTGSEMTLDVIPIGFFPSADRTGEVVEHTFEKIDELRKSMDAAVQADMARDKADYFGNTERHVRPISVTQASYTRAANTPAVSMDPISKTLTESEEFFGKVSANAIRAQRVYDDELMPFFNDKDQFRYNLVSNKGAKVAKLDTAALAGHAQKWLNAFSSDDEKAEVSLAAPLRTAIARCTSAAGNGDYSKCKTDAALDASIGKLGAAINEYAGQRIVRLIAEVPERNKLMSHRNGESECASIGMRLPKREEMALLGPLVTATANPGGFLASPAGEVWVASDSQCGRPIFQNGNGQGTFDCAGFMEELPWVGDRPVVCVGGSGPVAVRPAP